jgi:hypothetical protein
MNNGTMRGFTWQTLPAGATYPEMKVQRHQYSANKTFGSGDIDTLHYIESSSAVSVELDGAGCKNGQCIHVMQYGASGVTFTNTDGTLRCAGTATTRAQYSVMTAMLLDKTANEWLVFGDFTA